MAMMLANEDITVPFPPTFTPYKISLKLCVKLSIRTVAGTLLINCEDMLDTANILLGEFDIIADKRSFTGFKDAKVWKSREIAMKISGRVQYAFLTISLKNTVYKTRNMTKAM